MAHLNRDLELILDEGEGEGFNIPEHWEPARNQWRLSGQINVLFSSSEFGCKDCQNEVGCKIKKDVSQAMGGNYSCWPKSWLTIQPAINGPLDWPYDEKGNYVGKPEKRTLCKERVANKPA